MFPNIQELNIYIICGKTDLRKGIDGLVASLRELYGENEVPYDHSRFVVECLRSFNHDQIVNLLITTKPKLSNNVTSPINIIPIDDSSPV